jgi:hypothetical protein
MRRAEVVDVAVLECMLMFPFRPLPSFFENVLSIIRNIESGTLHRKSISLAVTRLNVLGCRLQHTNLNSFPNKLMFSNVTSSTAKKSCSLRF